MTYLQNPLSLFWDNHYLPTDELHQKRQNHQGNWSVESCFVCPWPDTKVKDVLTGSDKFFYFYIFGKLGMDVPKLQVRTGSDTDSFLSMLEYSQIPKRKSKYLYPNSKSQQVFFFFLY